MHIDFDLIKLIDWLQTKQDWHDKTFQVWKVGAYGRAAALNRKCPFSERYWRHDRSKLLDKATLNQLAVNMTLICKMWKNDPKMFSLEISCAYLPKSIWTWFGKYNFNGLDSCLFWLKHPFYLKFQQRFALVTDPLKYLSINERKLRMWVIYLLTNMAQSLGVGPYPISYIHRWHSCLEKNVVGIYIPTSSCNSN